MPTKILITGATGFIGRRLIQALAPDRRYALRAATRGEGAGLPPFVDVVRGLEAASQRQPDIVEGVDYVVHLAGRVHIMSRASRLQFDEYERINVDWTLALARDAAEAGVRRFIFMSSIAVNGNSTEPGAAYSEESPVSPSSAYAQSKALAETGLQEVARTTGIEVVLIRPPLVYGPGVKGNFRSLMNWIARGVPLPLGAVRDNRRTLLALDNLVELIRICLDHPAAANQVFVAGDAEDLSTADLTKRLAAAMGVPARLFNVPPALMERALEAFGMEATSRRLLHNLRIDASKAKQVLGWTPAVSAAEGLRLTAEDWRRR